MFLNTLSSNLSSCLPLSYCKKLWPTSSLSLEKKFNQLYKVDCSHYWISAFSNYFLGKNTQELTHFFAKDFPHITKKLELDKLLQGALIPDMHHYLLNYEIADCRSPLVLKANNSTLSKVVSFFANFIENLVDALSFFDGKEPPSSIYEKHVGIQIYYQFFTIPIVIAGILQPLILITWKVYLTTALTLATLGTSLYAYMTWFRSLPKQIAYCENLDETISCDYTRPIHGLENEVTCLISKLNQGTPCQKKCRPIMLLANSGEGKTTLVYKLHQMIKNGQVPNGLKNKKIFLIKAGKLMAKSSMGIGDKLKTIETKLASFKDKYKNEAIVFIDEIHVFAETNASFELMKDFLRNSSIQFIAATTFIDFNKIKEKDEDYSFRRPLSYISFNKWTPSELKKLLIDMSNHCNSRLAFSEEAIDKVITLTNSYLPDQSQPTKAIKLLEAVMQKSEMNLENLSSKNVLIKLQNDLQDLQEKYFRSYPQLDKSLIEKIQYLENLISQRKIDEKRSLEKKEFFKALLSLKKEQKESLLKVASKLHLQCTQKQPLSIFEQKKYLFSKFYLIPALDKMIEVLLHELEKEADFVIDVKFVEKVFEEYKVIEEKVVKDDSAQDSITKQKTLFWWCKW